MMQDMFNFLVKFPSTRKETVKNAVVQSNDLDSKLCKELGLSDHCRNHVIADEFSRSQYYLSI